MIFLDQALTHNLLVRGMGVAHVKHFRFGPDVHLRVAVAVQAPAHRERGGLPGQRHTVDSSMALGTAEPFIYMNAVIEIHEIGQVIDSCPLNRPSRFVAYAHRREIRRSRPQLGMTVHTSLSRWDIRKRRDFNGNMAIAAVQAESAYVMRVTKRKGLLARHILFHFVWGAHDLIPDP